MFHSHETKILLSSTQFLFVVFDSSLIITFYVEQFTLFWPIRELSWHYSVN